MGFLDFNLDLPSSPGRRRRRSTSTAAGVAQGGSSVNAIMGSRGQGQVRAAPVDTVDLGEGLPGSGYGVRMLREGGVLPRARQRVNAILARLPEELQVAPRQIHLDADLDPEATGRGPQGVTYMFPDPQLDKILISEGTTRRLGAPIKELRGQGLPDETIGRMQREQKAAQQVVIHEAVHANQDLSRLGDRPTMEGGAELLSRKVARDLTGFRYPTDTHPYQPYVRGIRRRYGGTRGGVDSILRILEGG